MEGAEVAIEFAADAKEILKRVQEVRLLVGRAVLGHGE